MEASCGGGRRKGLQVAHSVGRSYRTGKFFGCYLFTRCLLGCRSGRCKQPRQPVRSASPSARVTCRAAPHSTSGVFTVQLWARAHPEPRLAGRVPSGPALWLLLQRNRGKP
ncbi:hypothetical protein NDU88_007974 [Pleurodeles waltl]|uniref:Uncharacterized protein n=1 Tax=Pleurodeles waltl TaxID=8319 RepID=A0AAV7QMB2_PLEWA|nr:hypothetical protein NDU88_007974 [Pleurodeles waltl]